LQALEEQGINHPIQLQIASRLIIVLEVTAACTARHSTLRARHVSLSTPHIAIARGIAGDNRRHLQFELDKSRNPVFN
jgi:hypothetical protein